MKVKIDGMTCKHCAATVIKATAPFATDTPVVDLEEGVVVFTPTDAFEEATYTEVIDALGYEVVK